MARGLLYLLGLLTLFALLLAGCDWSLNGHGSGDSSSSDTGGAGISYSKSPNNSPGAGLGAMAAILAATAVVRRRAGP